MTVGAHYITRLSQTLNSHPLTQQDNDAGQDGDERPRAESGRQHVRLHVARQDGVLGVAGTHTDGQRAGAAQGRVAVVVDLHWQEVDVLRQAAEAPPQHVDASCAVWERKQQRPQRAPVSDEAQSHILHNDINLN